MAIDLSRLPAPDAIQALDFDALNSQFIVAFKAFWATARADSPDLPDYDVELLETDPAIVVGEAFSAVRLHDRARVNEAVRSVLAPFATGSNLDAVAASQGIARPMIASADPVAGTLAVMMSDDKFRQMYLESFDLPSAGSADLYKFVARRAWPLIGDVKINGRIVHGRAGDADVVIMGPGGRDATTEERTAVSAAVRNPATQPEAVAVAVIRSVPAPYTVDLLVEVPSGPDASILRSEIEARVRAATDSRTFIGAEIPPGFIPGAAYGANVIRVTDRNPVVIAPDPYRHPVCGAILVEIKVRT